MKNSRIKLTKYTKKYKVSYETVQNIYKKVIFNYGDWR